jgi:hypothetical protein
LHNIDSPPLSVFQQLVSEKVLQENSLTTGRKIMEYTKIGVPMFDGQNYSFWNKRMKTFLQAHGFDVWKSVVDGYTTPATPPTDKDGKKLSENNSKDKGTILSSLVDSVFVKVMHCDTAKDLWDKLQNIYEGDAKVKGAKLQTYRGKFEQLKMKEDEDIATYFLRVDEIVNSIKGLGEEIKESSSCSKGTKVSSNEI